MVFCRRFGLLWGIGLTLLVATPAMADPNIPGRSGIPAIDTLPQHEWDFPLARNNPLIALPLAALTPGGGHYYTKRYVRGGFITAIQLYLASEIWINYDLRTEKHRTAARQSLQKIDPLLENISSHGKSSPLYPIWRDSLQSELALYRKSNDMLMEEEGLHKSHIAWMVGLQLYGVMDSWNIVKRTEGRSYEERPLGSTVAWAIFLPGSGQLLNGEWGKAGLLYMSFIGSAASFQARQQAVEWYRNRLQVARQEESSELDELSEKLAFFRKKRNQYIWAPLLFYFYSIADAAVDALLADFDHPKNLAVAPQVDPIDAAVGLRLSWDF